MPLAIVHLFFNQSFSQMIISLEVRVTMMMAKMSIKKPNRSKLRLKLVPSGESDNIKYEDEDNHDPGKGGNTSYDNRYHLNLN